MGMIVFSLSACGGETLKPASIKPSDTVSQAAPGSTPDPAPGALPDSTPVAAPDPPPAGASGQTAPPVVQRSIILSTTTSVNDSGLLDYLQPFLKEETGITLDILAQGSGQALATAAAGDADVVIAHSPAAEKKFVEDRSGYDRTEFMHNFYVIAGPVGDPANLRSATDVASAMAQILETGNLFISRGDESGTHTKEKSLWALSGIDYESYRQTYLSVGKGMGDTLVMASEMQGYTLTDVSTFLSMKARLELEAIVDSGADLKNIYSIILVCEQEGKNIKTEDARDFMDWLLSDHTKELIAGYGIEEYGEPLFFIGI
jgi:tungstate transport system substrate-binding protein